MIQFLATLLLLSPAALAQAAQGQKVEEAKFDDSAPAGGAFEGHDGKTKTDGGAGDGTYFNGRFVPPCTNLTSADIKDTVANGTWLVEFFSPSCSHCKHFAPTWQTLYEFYYTNDPLPSNVPSSDPSLSSFTSYYDFHFAKIDCIANGDGCSDFGVTNFPQVKLIERGEVIDTKSGAHSIGTVSEMVEAQLEKIKPGSRPEGGPKLPKAGDKSVDDPSKPPKAMVEPVAPAVKQVLTATKAAKSASTETPNPLGKSVLLTAESFQHVVTTTENPWFIKFFTPWCHHCQSMAPNWKEMARQKKGELNIGEVNCDVEKRLCKDVGVKGYPTIMFFRGGERIDYKGLRGLGDLIDFGTKAVAVAGGVHEVDAAEFEELEKKEEVVFLYTYDQATTSEDFAALDRLVMSLIGHAKLVKSRDPKLAQKFKISTWPRLLVSRDGQPSYYDGMSPRDMRDYRRVLDWMRSVWLPIVPEMTAGNAKEIMENKIVVIGILNRAREEDFNEGKRELKNAALEWIEKQQQAFHLAREELRDAKKLRIEEAEDRNNQRELRAAKSIRINMEDIERKEVTFAWIDGVFWERWIRTTYGLSAVGSDRVIINDQNNRRYWDHTITGNAIVPSRTSILETLPKIVANPPKLRAKTTHTTLGHFLWTIKRGFVQHPILNGCIIVAIAVSIGIWWRNRIRNGKGGGLKLTEKNSNGMDGLLNGSFQPQGKVD